MTSDTIPAGELILESHQTNPPRPLGFHVTVDGHSVAVLSLEQVENAYLLYKSRLLTVTLSVLNKQ